MHFSLILKAGFLGFALSLGVLLVVFFVCGLLGVSKRRFIGIFTLAGLSAFVLVYLYLRLKIIGAGVEQPQVFLIGTIGGWLGGILAGMTNVRKTLLGMLK